MKFRSVKPIGYPIPTHTTVGGLLNVQNRRPFRPAHIHVLAYKEGYKTFVNQTYVDETELIESDVQFGVTNALTGKLQLHSDPHPEDGDRYSLEHNYTLYEGVSKLPIPPIK